MSERYVLSADGFDVYDSWYCYEEVYVSPYEYVQADPSFWRRVNPPRAHAITYRELDKLNAAHEEWLREDVEARKGTAS